MLQIQSRAEVVSNHYAGVWSAPIPTEGFAIPNDRLWSKWRRHRDGNSGASAAPRSLKHLLKQVEKGTQVRRSGLEQVLAELELHRDTTPDPDARSALAWLCNAVSRFVRNPTAARAREVMMAAEVVKRIPAAAD
jgi:hypothetical protein